MSQSAKANTSQYTFRDILFEGYINQDTPLDASISPSLHGGSSVLSLLACGNILALSK